MRKIVKYVMIAMLLGLTSLASATPVGKIDVVNGAQAFYWSNTTAVFAHGFISPIVLAANESFVGVQARSKRMCFDNSTTIGYYNPGKLDLIIPKTANNDKELSYKGVIRNNTTKAVRVVSLNIDNWDEIPSTSLPWNIVANRTVTYGGSTAKYVQPLISYASGTVSVRLNADVISGFVFNSVPVCNINPDNIKGFVLTYSTGIPKSGTISQSQGSDHNYTVTFPGIVTGVPFTIKMVMYKGDQVRWLDMSFFAPGVGITFNSNNTMTAH